MAQLVEAYTLITAGSEALS